jgi:hypothetical protein
VVPPVAPVLLPSTTVPRVRDTWLDRVGIPVLDKTIEHVNFVMGCLSEEDRQQEHAKQDLAEVRSKLRQIIQDLHTK